MSFVVRRGVSRCCGSVNSSSSTESPTVRRIWAMLPPPRPTDMRSCAELWWERVPGGSACLEARRPTTMSSGEMPDQKHAVAVLISDAKKEDGKIDAKTCGLKRVYSQRCDVHDHPTTASRGLKELTHLLSASCAQVALKPTTVAGQGPFPKF